jgi:hypothetical protein
MDKEEVMKEVKVNIWFSATVKVPKNWTDRQTEGFVSNMVSNVLEQKCEEFSSAILPHVEVEED